MRIRTRTRVCALAALMLGVCTTATGDVQVETSPRWGRYVQGPGPLRDWAATFNAHNPSPRFVVQGRACSVHIEARLRLDEPGSLLLALENDPSFSLRKVPAEQSQPQLIIVRERADRSKPRRKNESDCKTISK